MNQTILGVVLFAVIAAPLVISFFQRPVQEQPKPKSVIRKTQ